MIAQKLLNYPSILGEFNFKFEKDFNTKKLMFLDQYLKINYIKADSYKAGYLPLLMAFNKNSKSTPCWMVQCPNRQGICKTEEIGATRPLGTDKLAASLDHETDVKNKSLSYNECIKDYDLSLLTPN